MAFLDVLLGTVAPIALQSTFGYLEGAQRRQKEEAEEKYRKDQADLAQKNWEQQFKLTKGQNAIAARDRAGVATIYGEPTAARFEKRWADEDMASALQTAAARLQGEAAEFELDNSRIAGVADRLDKGVISRAEVDDALLAALIKARRVPAGMTLAQLQSEAERRVLDAAIAREIAAGQIGEGRRYATELGWSYLTPQLTGRLSPPVLIIPDPRIGITSLPKNTAKTRMVVMDPTDPTRSRMGVEYQVPETKLVPGVHPRLQNVLVPVTQKGVTVNVTPKEAIALNRQAELDDLVRQVKLGQLSAAEERASSATVVRRAELTNIALQASNNALRLKKELEEIGDDATTKRENILNKRLTAAVTAENKLIGEYERAKATAKEAGGVLSPEEEGIWNEPKTGRLAVARAATKRHQDMYDNFILNDPVVAKYAGAATGRKDPGGVFSTAPFANPITPAARPGAVPAARPGAAPAARPGATSSVPVGTPLFNFDELSGKDPRRVRIRERE